MTKGDDFQLTPYPRRLGLAAELFREAPRQFFGVLASGNAPLRVDALNALERSLY